MNILTVFNYDQKLKEQIVPSFPAIYNTLVEGSNIGNSYVQALDYLWQNHSNSFSILRQYNLIKKYEKDYKLTSEELLNRWTSGSLTYRDSYINDWLSTYLQIKNFIK